MIKDYHNHTFRCKHAIGEVSDYAEMAVKKGLKVLGMSDHTPLPDNRWLEVRMEFEELKNYVDAIDTARLKYPDVKILKGMECEYAKEYHNFFKDELLGKLEFDYLITSAHFFPLEGEWIATWDGAKTYKGMKAYSEYVVESMSSGLFTFAAHPDMFGISCDKWDENVEACCRYIFEAAQALKMPLEVNAYGCRKPKIHTADGLRNQYPLIPFWELAAEYDISVLVNSDSHSPEDILCKTDEAYNIVETYGLKLADLSYLESNSSEKY